MNALEGVWLALAQIRAQKLKSFFSLIGVLIGVMFLMTVVSVIQGMNKYMEEDFARQVYGLNTVTVRRTPSVQFSNLTEEERRARRRRPRLKFDDADQIRARLEVPALVAVESGNGGKLQSSNGTEVENVWITGASAEFFRIREFEVAQGRLFDEPEDRLGAPVIVLGHEAADKLFGRLNPIGRTAKVNGFPFQVIGVLDKQGSLFGISLDNRAIAPARSPMSRFVNPHGVVDEILVRTSDPQSMARALVEVEAIMRTLHRLRPGEANDFEVETADDSMTFWTRISNVLMIAFPFLVGIGLVVGGMVIMNIMLVSVAERTREIGMRKAIGARSNDILLQILVEAATLSGLGAALGILIGIAGGQVVAAISPLPAAITPFWIGVSALLGIGVGVLAGIYPASRAARMDPIAALRFE